MQDSWRNHSDAMLHNGSDTFNRSSSGGHGPRSQDDANVGYSYQRPQPDMSQAYQKRWPVGDDSVLEHVSSYQNIAHV